MDVYGNINQTLQKICQTQKDIFYIAQVKQVSGQTCTVIINNTLELTDVRLRAVVNDEQSGILVTPTVGSFVMITDLSNGDKRDWAVVMYSQIDKIEINSGKNGGLINIEDLKNNLDQLKNYVEALNTAVSTGLSAIGESTAASGTAGKTAYTTAMTGKSINFQNMEDTKITH